MPRPRRPRPDDDDANDANDIRPKRIDLNLPEIVLHGLDDWNSRFDHVEDEEDANLLRDIFALTGTYTEEGERYRAGLDVERYRLTDEVDLSCVCDFDSVIGTVLGRFPISHDATFNYYPLADAWHTLSENLHTPHATIVRQELGERVGGQPRVTRYSVPIHHIPNARLGEIGRLTIRVAFPELYNANETWTRSSNALGDDILRPFFDEAARPAANEVLPEELIRTWPARYEDELWRAAPHRSGGRVRATLSKRQHTARTIHGRDFNEWLDRVRHYCEQSDELSFARGFILLVEGKGLKDMNGSQHEPPEEPVADEGTISLLSLV